MTSETPMKPGQTTLDSPPPAASTGQRKMSLMDATGKKDEKVPPSPQVAVMLGMNMMEQGARLISMALPQVAPALQQIISGLRDNLPRAMAETPVSGLPAPVGGGAVPTQGGPVASPPPPGGPPQ